MGDFRRDRRFGRDNSRGRFDRRERSFGGGRRRPEMHDVICDQCGKECQVPFKPTGDKPVLCSSCFGGKSPSRDNFSSDKAGISSQQFSELNSKLDKILEILENIDFEETEEDSEEESEEESEE